MKNLAVITARGGSKRIPKKNIKEFCGKPIIAYSIQAALESKCFDEVMVSTDNIEIKEIALHYGATVPFLRSEGASDDFATTKDVLFEVLEDYKKAGVYFTSMCCIYPTAPFVTAAKLREAMQLLHSTGADSVIPVVPFSFPPQRGFLLDKGNVRFQYPEHEASRSQDLVQVYHDCGQYYCINVGRFLHSGKLFTENTKAVIADEMEVQDIDNLADWKLAEMKYRLLAGEAENP